MEQQRVHGHGQQDGILALLFLNRDGEQLAGVKRANNSRTLLVIGKPASGAEIRLWGRKQKISANTLHDQTKPSSRQYRPAGGQQTRLGA